jgi:hypothetical protein
MMKDKPILNIKNTIIDTKVIISLQQQILNEKEEVKNH